VAKIRRLLRLKRVGHAGTLDPAAMGVLPIALGRATRLLQFLPQGKAYRATIRLGIQTTTDDLEGDIITQQPVPALAKDSVEAALQSFCGTIQQVPPNYSAIQVQGKRLYSLAREGQEVAVEARAVEVYELQMLAWRPGEFPELDVEIVCGPGTYIRAIARDLGQLLQTGGTLASLLRTESSGFLLADSKPLEELAAQVEQGTFQPLAPEFGVRHLPAIALSDQLARRWCLGQRIAWSDMPIGCPELNRPLRIHHADGDFLGVGQAVLGDRGEAILSPQVVFPMQP
jgi:tRNA pseudouridine55 synthase